MKRQNLLMLILFAVILIFMAATPTFFKGAVKAGSTSKYCTIDENGIVATGSDVDISGFTDFTIIGDINFNTLNGVIAIVGSDTDYLTIDNSGIVGSGTVNVSGITNITNSGYLSTGYIKANNGKLCGTASIDSGGSSILVTYDSVYDTVPIIVATATDSYSIYISTSTETSCYLMLTTGTVGTTTTINWIAIEPQ